MDGCNLPWIEKYRPKNLEEMIDHQEKISTIKNLIVKNELPHLLFYGPPGTGKTSLILATAREMYGNDYRMHILELNASDDRGIDIVRNKIPNFVKIKSNKLRLVILDEADAMTQDAQSALRRVMEKYVNTSRFCLICNNFNKIIPGIKSRCSIMRFGVLNVEEIAQKMQHIIDIEKVHITAEGITTLIKIQKDFRQILNTLQCLHSIRVGTNGVDYSAIDVQEIYDYLGKPGPAETQQLIKDLFEGTFQETYNKFIDLFRDNKWNMYDLIHYLCQAVIVMDIKEEQKFYLLQKFSKIEYRIVTGRDTEIQLAALVAAFTHANCTRTRHANCGRMIRQN